MAKNKQYSFWKGLLKAIITIVLIGIPVVLDILPQEILNLTLGGILVLVLNYLKVKYSK